MSLIKTICVFSGSSSGFRTEYADAARGLGVELVRRGIGLVYGGARVGLMGALADAVLEGDGRITGVVPQFIVDKDVAHRDLPDLRVVESMHERKALMAELADGFIALPGGFGTLDELFEILTWAQLGLHEKPSGVLDVCGFYKGLFEFLDQTVAEGFVKSAHRGALMRAETAGALLDQFEAYLPVRDGKWFDSRVV